MEAMTSEREAFEVRKGSNGEWGIYAKGYNVRIATFETVSALTRNRVAELLAGDANIAQPAQAVDVDYVPGELDRTAPERVWLQIDTSASNDVRNEAWPGADGVTWQDESIGGLEIQYVRADLATRALSGEKAGPVGDGRSTHNVYRYSSTGVDYEEIPCYCGADRNHPIGQEVPASATLGKEG